MSISPYLQINKGIYRETTCGSAEFESWKWSNVKMYTDDIVPTDVNVSLGFFLERNVSLRKICDHVSETRDANWNEVKTS